MHFMFGKVHLYLFYCAANTAFQVGGGEDGNKASLVHELHFQRYKYGTIAVTLLFSSVLSCSGLVLKSFLFYFFSLSFRKC